jgi:hypothetical protein
MIEGNYIYIGEDDLYGVKNHQTYLCTQDDDIIYIWRKDEWSGYYTDYITSVYLETFHKFFITLAEWRDRQIDKILEDD